MKTQNLRPMECTQKRELNRRYRLSKAVRMVHRRAGMVNIPPSHRFNRPVLVPTSSFLRRLPALLFIKDYDILLCDSVAGELPEDFFKGIEYLRDEFLVFKDRYSAECKTTRDVVEHHQRHFPGAKFVEVSESNAQSVLEDYPDLLLGLEALPDGKELYSEHVKNGETLCRENSVSRGTLYVSHGSSELGEVLSDSGQHRTVIVGRNAMNRALHGDEVYVEENKVIGIAKKRQRGVVGTVFDEEKIDGGRWLVKIRPIDRRYPDIAALSSKSWVYKEEGHKKTKLIEGREKVFVWIGNWDKNQELPRGVIVRLVGRNGVLEDEVRALLENYGVDYYAKESKEYDFETKLDEEREDLRKLCILSVDPPGCTDIDDAVHAIRQGDGYEVGVHIADVSWYVPEGSEIDKEAKFRSTTIYLPDRRYDMLPSQLSSNLCSLLPCQDRLAFSVVWKMDSAFNILDTRFFRSLIRTRAALTYDEAECIAVKGSTDPEVANTISLLIKLSDHLHQKRLERGAIILGSSEESSHPDVNTHQMIEELMVLANSSVAEFLVTHAPEYALLRKHPLPSSIDLPFIEQSRSINDSIALLSPEKATVARKLVTRSMHQALYFVRGDSSNTFHYGLALSFYTHFTSPIRRYADLLVHRSLTSLLSSSHPASLTSSITPAICSFMNYRHRNAQIISRLSKILFSYSSFSDAAPLDAIVLGSAPRGYLLYVPEYDFEAYVATDASYSLFDSLRVRICKDFSQFCIDRNVALKIIAE